MSKSYAASVTPSGPQVKDRARLHCASPWQPTSPDGRVEPSSRLQASGCTHDLPPPPRERDGFHSGRARVLQRGPEIVVVPPKTSSFPNRNHPRWPPAILPRGVEGRTGGSSRRRLAGAEVSFKGRGEGP